MVVLVVCTWGHQGTLTGGHRTEDTQIPFPGSKGSPQSATCAQPPDTEDDASSRLPLESDEIDDTAPASGPPRSGDTESWSVNNAVSPKRRGGPAGPLALARPRVPQLTHHQSDFGLHLSPSQFLGSRLDLPHQYRRDSGMDPADMGGPGSETHDQHANPGRPHRPETHNGTSRSTAETWRCPANVQTRH